jgi:hypothetical protein
VRPPSKQKGKTMPAKYFICPDGEQIEIEKCLSIGGCRMKERCATLPYLRLVGYDREWKGVTPSAAGNGARYLYLKATVDYAINPYDRVWAALERVYRKCIFRRTPICRTNAGGCRPS